MPQRTASAIRPALPRKGIQRRAPANALPATEKTEKSSPSQQRQNSDTQPKAPVIRSQKSCCANPKIVIDDESGGRVCENCGTVVEGRQYVNEVGFTETSTGAAVATGQRVGQFETHARGAFDRRAQAFRRGDEPLDSAERTTQKARKIITTLANSVRLSEVIQDEAVQVFRLCGPGSFLPGRTTTSVAVVCLYIACRRNPLDNAVLLIDLAEKTNTNVFKLGKLYTKIVDAMRFNEDLINKNNNQKIHIPKYAPESLIQRFVNELEFDREKNRVMTDAVKVFKRMRRDWIAEGRRPAGVCAAAVVLGARMNNFRRTVREVVYVAKVCELTINKRLDEFKITDTGKMTVDEFRDIDVETGREHDPPAFTRGNEPKKPKRLKRGRPRKHPEGETAAEIEGDDAETVAGPSQSAKRRRLDKDGFAIPEIPLDPNLRDGPAPQGNGAAQTTTGKNDSNPPMVVQLQNTESSSGQPQDSTPTPAAQQEGPKKRGRPKGSKNRKLPPPTPREAALEAEIEADVNQILERARPAELNDDPESTGTDTHPGELGEEQRQVWPHVRDIPMSPDIDPREFEDDPEVANCLLAEDESRAKEIIWVTENKDWLYKHMHNEFYRRKRELEGKKGGSGTNKKRHPRGDVSYISREEQDTEPREGETEEQATRRRALEAQIAMLKQRGTFSQAIDYWALADMGYDVKSHVGSSSSPGSSDRSRSGSRDVPSRPHTPFSGGSFSRGGSHTQRLNNAARRLRQSMSPSPQLRRNGGGSASLSPRPDRHRRISASASLPSSPGTRAAAPPLTPPANTQLSRRASIASSPSPSLTQAPGSLRDRDRAAGDRSSQQPPAPSRNIEEEIIGEIVPISNQEIDTDEEEVYDDDESIGGANDDEEDMVESAFQGQYRENNNEEDNDFDEDDW